MPSGPGGKTWWRVVRREKVETTADVLFTFTTTGEVLTVSGGARALLPAFPDEWQARVPALHPGTTRSRCYAAPLLSFRSRAERGHSCPLPPADGRQECLPSIPASHALDVMQHPS
jgi:hypothetical protein